MGTYGKGQGTGPALQEVTLNKGDKMYSKKKKRQICSRRAQRRVIIPEGETEAGSPTKNIRFPKGKMGTLLSKGHCLAGGGASRREARDQRRAKTLTRGLQMPSRWVWTHLGETKS